jgi:hypothetical protein
MINFYMLLFRLKLLLIISVLIFFNVSALAQFISKAPPKNNLQEIPGQYIVVYKKNSNANARTLNAFTPAMREKMMEEEVNSTMKKNNLSTSQVSHVYNTVLSGFAVEGLSPKDLEKLQKDEQIAYIVPNHVRKLSTSPKVAARALADGCAVSALVINGVRNSNIYFADFGPRADVTAEVVLVNDGSLDNPTFGCNPIINDLTGKIALIDRGICNFSVKAYAAQQAGAIGVIIANNTDDGLPAGMGAGTDAELVTIPVISISKAQGLLIQAALSSPLTVTIDYSTIGDDGQCTPWGVTRVAGGLSGVGKRAWIIDSGIDLDHPDLNVNVALSRYFVGSSPDDENGHGTHVAGTIAAIDNGIGVIGVAAGAEVVSLKVFSALESSSDAVILQAMDYAATNATMDDVVNMSLGGWPTRAFDDATYALSLKTRLVLSAGNDATDANFASPARVNGSNIYTVSAMDINDRLASFSNYGNAPIDFAAPGVNIASCDINGTYSFRNGTSMAAPHVAGLLLIGTICSDSKIIGDVDGKPDPIAVHLDPLTATDNDGDGVSVCAGDLDDNDPTVFPGASELCDGKDNDGDGIIDNECCPSGNDGTLYVNASATGANSGLTWTDAFTSLQSALTVAKRCSQITQVWVAKGTYYPSEDQFGQSVAASPMEKSFAMQNNLAIYGGFAGNEASNYDLAQRNLLENQTILSGDLQQDDDYENNSYHVILNFTLYEKPLNQTAILDGFTIREGSAILLTAEDEAHFPHSYGGGMATYHSTPTIRQCTFVDNQAYFGGAIANLEADLHIQNSQFIHNFALVGAGIYNRLANPTVSSSLFQLNEAINQGSGMYQFFSDPTIINSTFSGNKAGTNGGVIFNSNSFSIIKNSILWGNSSEISTTDNSTISYSIIQGWADSGTNNINVDPKFVQNPSFNDLIIGNLNIINCSPAINAGDPATNFAVAGAKDFNNSPRLFGDRVDIGAFEVQSTPVLITPMITASTSLNIIEGSSITLTATGADSYLWSNAETTASITVAPTTSTTYTVTGSSGSCSGISSVNVVVTPLPVTLIDFTAKAATDGSIKLSWSTANEVNNDYYEVERSTDMKRIDLVGKVAASEIGNQINSYQLSDEKPYRGTSYYRLKQTDVSGESKMFNWVSIVSNQTYLAYPNPVKQQHFQVQLDEPEEAKINLYSQDGKMVPLNRFVRGTNAVELHVPKNTASGVYVLQVEERAQSRQYKIVIEN